MFWDNEIRQLHNGLMPAIRNMTKCNEMGCKLLFPGQRISKEDQRYVRAFTLANLVVFRNFLEPRFLPHLTKEEYMEWMIDDGASAALESLARGVRKSKERHNSNPDIPFELKWYDMYMLSKRWHEVKGQAKLFFEGVNRLHCQINRKHMAEEFHHTSYENLGTSKEWEDLIPLCASCHEMIRKRGPRLPKKPPDALVRELLQEGKAIT